MAVQSAPTASHRLGEFLPCHVAHTHRHADFAAKLQGELDVLVEQTQLEARRIELAGQEAIAPHLVGAHPPHRALTDGFPQRQRLKTGLDAHGEGFAQRLGDDSAGQVVHQLGNRAGTDIANVAGLITHCLYDRLILVIGGRAGCARHRPRWSTDRTRPHPS